MRASTAIAPAPTLSGSTKLMSRATRPAAASSSRGPTTTSPLSARISRTYSGAGALKPSPRRCPTVKRCTPSWAASACPVGIDDTARAKTVRRRRSLDEAGVVAVGHEANLLALGLVGVGETKLARASAHLGLGHRAERKKRAAQLKLAEREQKVRLILGGVGSAQQMEAAARVALDTGIVAGRDVIRAERRGALAQAIELDLAIAHHARVRRAAGRDTRRRNCRSRGRRTPRASRPRRTESPSAPRPGARPRNPRASSTSRAGAPAPALVLPAPDASPRRPRRSRARAKSPQRQSCPRRPTSRPAPARSSCGLRHGGRPCRRDRRQWLRRANPPPHVRR